MTRPKGLVTPVFRKEVEGGAGARGRTYLERRGGKAEALVKVFRQALERDVKVDVRR